MNKPIDQQQRQQALNPAESFIVQAPAGSGKTELLIQRYLRMLAMVNSPEEIIAITFTRKAAAEMRGRILGALDQVLNSNKPGNAAAEITFKLVEQVIEQDRKHQWQLAENPGRLRIQTIDSLTASLTRQMPVLAGFGAQPETIENATELYQLAAANTLAELEVGDTWSDSIAVLLGHLDNDLPRVRNMLASMLARRDQWLRHIARQHQREELEEALAHLVEAELSRMEHCLPEQFTEELLALLRFAATNLQEQGSDSPIVQCKDIDTLPGNDPAELETWKAIVTLLFTQADSWRKTANTNLGFPAASGNKAESETRKAMKTRFAALIANLSEDRSLAAKLVEIKYLPPVVYNDSEWEVVEALYQLLILADAQLRLIFAERNQMDFSGITQAAIQSLGDSDTPTDLALQLDYQIKHILVDEFQDISINQYNLLEKLTAGWSEHDGHSLFLVGDPMQSIYRFREAEVGLFLNTWQQQRLNQVALTPLNITVNFRSDPGIVDWVNKAFKQILPNNADIGRGAVNYVKADPYHSSEEKLPVKLHPVISRDDLVEAEIISQLIGDARQKNAGDSIAILVRNRNHLKEIVALLRERKVAYRAVEIEALGQRAAIQDLLALTLALTHLADRVSWLAVLRAPWCGLELIDLHQLFAHDKNRCIWEVMQDSTQIETLNKNARSRLIEITEIVKDAFEEQGRRSLSRWVESVWMRIGGPASLQNESDLENTQTFFQLLNEFDEGGDLKDREAFTEKVASLYAIADTNSEDAVQIMTIHKAKGLEFDTIILPGLARGSGIDESRLLMWMERPHGYHQDLLLAPVKEAGKADSPIYNYLKRLEKEKQYYELGRLLYVATTRAKKYLHIITTAEPGNKDNDLTIKEPLKNSLLMQLWPVAKDTVENALKNKSPNHKVEKAVVQKKQLLLRRLKRDWLMPLAPESIKWQTVYIDEQVKVENPPVEYEWAGETIKHIGTVVHRCLQMMATEEYDSWDGDDVSKLGHFHQLLLKQLGVNEKELNDAVRQVQLALTNILSDERGQWLFSKDHKQAKNEYAISGLYQGKVVNVILDRTFIDAEGIRWIVDYKTSRHEGKDLDAFLDQQQQRYLPQLEKYGALIKSMENVPVKLGLYFPLLKGWREWDLEN
jgi:ATP-dependent helicase/nuclease subunit A